MVKGPKAPEENAGTKKLLGTFTAPPPLCIGEPYRNKGPPDPRIMGKQLTSGPLKHENSRIAPGTFTTPLLLWAEQKDKYLDGIRYKDLVPPDRKKNGFMSSDYPRRDEFSNTIRTSQLREVLKKETALMHEMKAQAEKRGTGAHTTANEILNSAIRPAKPPLYDVVYRIPEASLKLARDDRQAGLWYKQARSDALRGHTSVSPKRIDGAAWVNISLNGRPINVLVDELGSVLAKDATSSPTAKGPGAGIIDFS
mmetsp:Transcript_31391/g.74027  ORF Transcript_31391/g.74027 Transcript_31391/m.74027 type:complete len:254 (-) Transcript_31391:304-1065(-)